MSHEQIKGTFLAVGATAASTMLLVGGFVTIHNSYENAASVDPSTVIDVRAKQASDAAAGGTGEFSDHCLVMREGTWSPSRLRVGRQMNRATPSWTPCREH